MAKIFFDLDGTLINSEHRIYNLFVELCPECKMSYEAYWKIKRQRITQKDFLKKYFDYTDDMCAQFHQKWLQKIEEPERLREDFLVEGIECVLKDFSKKEILGTSPRMTGFRSESDEIATATKSPRNDSKMSERAMSKEMLKQVQHDARGQVCNDGLYSGLAMTNEKNLLYVVTNRQSESLTLKELETLGIKKYFDKILVTEQQKTKTDLMQNEECVADDILITDTGEDIRVAHKLGIQSIAVCWGVLNEDILTEYAPTMICKTVHELYKTLEQLNKTKGQ